MFSACRHLLSCNDALEAELCTLSEGILLALQWSILPIHIETDCLEAINILENEKPDRSRFLFLIQEIKLKLVK